RLSLFSWLFSNGPSTSHFYSLSLHDALPISLPGRWRTGSRHTRFEKPAGSALHKSGGELLGKMSPRRLALRRQTEYNTGKTGPGGPVPRPPRQGGRPGGAVPPCLKRSTE